MKNRNNRKNRVNVAVNQQPAKPNTDNLTPVQQSNLMLDKMIAECVTSVNTMQEQIQKCCIAIALHAQKHANYDHANKLMRGLGEGVRKIALQNWFETYCGLVVDSEDPKKGFTSWKKPAFIEKNLDAGKRKPWFKCKPAPTFQGFDFADKVEALQALAQKQLNAKVELSKSEKDEDVAKADKINVTKSDLELLGELMEKLAKNDDTAKVQAVEPLKVKCA
ncbi:hypothetical protein NVP1262O_74 [Vibrio phage 1.262.O._10N.286.51.A9]|nr:hypothetical protein NVP1262O_74 [Vibrio phage 1.262.O._10N.286.51.A9]